MRRENLRICLRVLFLPPCLILQNPHLHTTLRYSRHILQSCCGKALEAVVKRWDSVYGYILQNIAKGA